MVWLSYLLVPTDLSLAACGGLPGSPDEAESDVVLNAESPARILPSEGTGAPMLERFSSDPLARQPEGVDCTLTDGTTTQCPQIVVKYKHGGLQIGPFCSENIYSDVGGVWQWDGDDEIAAA